MILALLRHFLVQKLIGLLICHIVDHILDLLLALASIHRLLQFRLSLQRRLILRSGFPPSLLWPLLLDAQILLRLRWLVQSLLPILDPRLPPSLLRHMRCFRGAICRCHRARGRTRRHNLLSAACLARLPCLARLMPPLLAH